MYFVDRKQIEDRLQYMEQLGRIYNQIKDESTAGTQLALERLAHGWIEALIDVGNQMIDGFIMRDPGSYEDIVDILEDERVLEAEVISRLKPLVAFRKKLVQEFTSIEFAEISQVLEEAEPAVEKVSPSVRNYLEEELGPVSAFLPEEKDTKE
ncbi:DUF86 domain-containing protein [uncultured Marinococcus sp.]|jgi:uncharacterized protein YutE (UPF0331/DUF86 family)|uniref:DUF86 domain-containing protein n=1 Tax=uncultured Marinococcus sp. TaxID=487012 RepID=UPI0026132DBE|nr:DUF86 domain-containing protein [uncultured Marinococcus sp.]